MRAKRLGTFVKTRPSGCKEKARRAARRLEIEAEKPFKEAAKLEKLAAIKAAKKPVGRPRTISPEKREWNKRRALAVKRNRKAYGPVKAKFIAWIIGLKQKQKWAPKGHYFRYHQEDAHCKF